MVISAVSAVPTGRDRAGYDRSTLLCHQSSTGGAVPLAKSTPLDPHPRQCYGGPDDAGQSHGSNLHRDRASTRLNQICPLPPMLLEAGPDPAAGQHYRLIYTGSEGLMKLAVGEFSGS